MANSFREQINADGRRNLAVVYNITGDGSGDESARLLVDLSTLSQIPDAVRIDKVAWNLGFEAKLLWDADTDVLALHLPEGEGTQCFGDIGGLQNDAGTGKTGHINITTDGLADEVTGTISLWCVKKYTGS